MLSADLVVQLADASAADEQLDEQIAAVDAVLAEIGAAELPTELVLNKIDALDPLARRRLRNRFPGAVHIAARTGEGLEELRARIAERLAGRFELVRLLIPHADGARLAELYELGAPIENRVDLEEGVLIHARLPSVQVPRFGRYLVAEAGPETARARG
jgi:GTPase